MSCTSVIEAVPLRIRSAAALYSSGLGIAAGVAVGAPGSGTVAWRGAATGAGVAGVAGLAGAGVAAFARSSMPRICVTGTSGQFGPWCVNQGVIARILWA